MSYDTPNEPLSGDLLASRFDNAHLVRVSHEAGLIAVWNGSQTINLYTFRFDEVSDGPRSVPKDDNGNPASREEINDHIEDLFDEYTNY